MTATATVQPATEAAPGGTLPDSTPAPGAADVMAAWAIPVLGTVLALIVAWRCGLLRPGGLTRGGRREPERVSPAVWLLAAAGGYLGMVLGASLVGLGLGGLGSGAGAGGENPESIHGSALLALGAGLGGVLAAGGLARWLHMRAKRAGLAARPTDPLVGLGWFCLLLPVVLLTGAAATLVARWLGAPTESIAHSTLQDIAQHAGSPAAWGLVASAVLLAPVAEELIYRGFLQSAALAAFKRPWAAVLVTSALFTLAHVSAVPEGGRHALAVLFVLSVGIGAAFERTRRLWVCVAIHALFNAWNVGLALLA